VSVTDREVEGTPFSVKLVPLGKVSEVFVLGESRLGEAVLAGEKTGARLDDILQVVSNKSFPADRSRLSEGERHQLRDAMILEAHHRAGNEIFVTNDKKGFVNHGRREKLEALLGTQILTPEGFREWCEAHAKEVPLN